MRKITEYAVRALIIAALLIGSALLSTTNAFAEGGKTVAYVFRGIGIAGFVAGLFFGQRLIRNIKHNK